MSETAGATRVGVLALQGDFDAHTRTLTRLGAEPVPVRKLTQLEQVQGLVIPGGESTTLLKLLEVFGMWDGLRDWIAAGHPVFGTCAGAILLARQVLNPAQPGLDLIDITVERNAYGRQVDSFETTAPFRPRPGDERPIEMVFIRAPRICRLGDGVESLGQCRGDTVIARQGHVLVATFHPELGAGDDVHGFFLEMVRDA